MSDNPNTSLSHNLNSHDLDHAEVGIAAVQDTRSRFESAVTPEMVKLYAHMATEIKSKIDDLGAQICVRQDKMKLLKDIHKAINNATDENNELDISKNEDLKAKLEQALSLGVDLPKFDENKVKFNTLEKDRLIQNLDLTADGWDKENKTQTQKLDAMMKELDRYMMILKEISKDEKQTKSLMTREMAGR